jgi:hypothetical protein
MHEWAQRWGVHPAALDDLCRSVIYPHAPDPAQDETNASEARVQSEIRLEAANAGVYLFRNNVGAGKMASGNFVRYGLGNDSPALNEVLKSADLIGIRRRLITPLDVGCYIGQFVSREIKRTDWRFSGTKEEQAQARWATLINQQGGDAAIVQSVGSLTA